MVKVSFVQLFTIHAFIRKDSIVKEETLCFMLMSGRKRRDYVAFLHQVLEIWSSLPCMQQVVPDFELALWKVVKDVLIWTTHRNCAFH